jgi:hypothetical protein
MDSYSVASTSDSKHSDPDLIPDSPEQKARPLIGDCGRNCNQCFWDHLEWRFPYTYIARKLTERFEAQYCHLLKSSNKEHLHANNEVQSGHLSPNTTLGSEMLHSRSASRSRSPSPSLLSGNVHTLNKKHPSQTSKDAKIDHQRSPTSKHTE